MKCSRWISSFLVILTGIIYYNKIVGKPIDEGELTEKEIIRAERNLGVISSTLREIQVSYKL